MPWSDDTRCLYCDGKLPLYRKLTHGQFCSKAHQKQYWEEQQQLAVERLHQTHSDIKAYKPPEPIENILGPLGPTPETDFSFLDADAASILGPTETTPEPPLHIQREPFLAEDSPAMASFVSGAIDPISGVLIPFVATGSLEMDPVLRLEVPAWAASGAAGSMTRIRAVAEYLALAAFAPKDVAVVPAGAHPELEIAVNPWKPSAALALAQVELPAAETPAEIEAPEPVLEPAAPVAIEPVAIEPVAIEPPLVDRLRWLELEPVSCASANIHGEISNSGHYVPETATPVLERITAPVLSLAAGGLQPLALLPAASEIENVAEIRPAELVELKAEKPASKLIGTPLAPAHALVNLQWNVELVSGAAAPEPASAKALTPHVTPMLPAASEAQVVPVKVEPPAVEQPVQPEGPTEIPGFAGRLPMHGLLVVRQANRKLKLAFGRGILPDPLPGIQIIPTLRLVPATVELEPAPAPAPVIEPVPGPVVEAAAARRRGLAGFWAQAPRDLKLLALAIPVLIGLAFHSLPKVTVSADSNPIPSGFRQAISEQFANLKQTVANRAAIALDEDFRGGLDNWISRTGATAEWTFDATGFVQPGPLALYDPSLKLTDYQMQFLGMIEQKSMSWVVRAEDFENYYVIKLQVLKPGPLPTLGLTRYAVIDGKPVDRVDRPVQISARPDTIYRVRMDVYGSNFALEIQGQMIDTWSEPRLKRGGVGFFTGRGEKSRVRWVQLTHQYDVLGRLCAYLAPYEF